MSLLLIPFSSAWVESQKSYELVLSEFKMNFVISGFSSFENTRLIKQYELAQYLFPQEDLPHPLVT